ncbi:MAG: hypothetical protein ACFBSE_16000 [Prochloraceae cyanobacterium]
MSIAILDLDQTKLLEEEIKKDSLSLPSLEDELFFSRSDTFNLTDNKHESNSILRETNLSNNSLITNIFELQKSGDNDNYTINSGSNELKVEEISRQQINFLNDYLIPDTVNEINISNDNKIEAVAEEAFFGNTSGLFTNSNSNIVAQQVRIVPITLTLIAATTGLDSLLPSGGFTSLVVRADASALVTDINLSISVTLLNQNNGIDIAPPRADFFRITQLGVPITAEFNTGFSTGIVINGGSGTADVLRIQPPFGIETLSAEVPPAPQIIIPQVLPGLGP